MLFSVVQNTTLTPPPSGIARRAVKNSIPFMTGMFQSSSTSTGISARQASSACAPSAASRHSNPKPSTIMRASFRTTELSSTIRHFFMTLFPVHSPLFDIAQQRGHLQQWYGQTVFGTKAGGDILPDTALRRQRFDVAT